MNFRHLMPDQKFGLSKAIIKTDLQFTDHDVVLLTIKVYNEDHNIVYVKTIETHTLQDCISETVRSALEHYIWDTEK